MRTGKPATFGHLLLDPQTVQTRARATYDQGRPRRIHTDRQGARPGDPHLEAGGGKQAIVRYPHREIENPALCILKGATRGPLRSAARVHARTARVISTRL